MKIVVKEFGIVSMGLKKPLEELEIKGRIDTIQTTTLLGFAKILSRVMETKEDLQSLRPQWKLTSKL